jgi:integrase
MALGVADNPTGRAVAKRKAAEIEIDISAGYFDSTLLKYKPQTIGKNATLISTFELFNKFSQHKLKNEGVSPRSIETRYKPLGRYLERSLNIEAQEVTPTKARNFAAVLTESLAPGTAKAHLWLLQSCWDWAKGRYHLAENNPWNGLAAAIKNQPNQKVKPFTTAEIKAIIQGFRSNRFYHHYTDLVMFLFGSGCRFGEAAGLRWKHVATDFETLWIGESYSRGYRKSTKTGKSRTIVLSSSISKMLRDRNAALQRNRFNLIQPKPDELVFPSPKGIEICDRNFRNRAWKTILAECHIEYRKP